MDENDELFAQFRCETTLGTAGKSLEMLGSSETLCFKGTATFPNRERYVVNDGMEDTLARIRRAAK